MVFVMQAIATTWPRTIDDSLARKDWGWQPKFDIDVSALNIRAAWPLADPAFFCALPVQPDGPGSAGIENRTPELDLRFLKPGYF